MLSTRPKLRDVADLANVSIGTASQALNNKSSVLPKTRKRVIQAAQELGYELPIRASSTAEKISTLGVLVKTHAHQDTPIDSFYGAVLSGAEQECKRHNISLMYASLPVDALSNVIDWPPLTSDQQVDGWLIMGAFVSKTRGELDQCLQKPVVLVDAYALDSYCDMIVTDNWTGAYNAVVHLIDNGHRCIGLIGSSPNGYPSIRERRQGYLNALADHGIEKTYIENSSLHSAGARDATQRLLKRAPEITGIFACNDDVAIATIHAAHDLGLQVPNDLSVVGFDDLEHSAEIIPPLTTIAVEKMLMGTLGVRQLLERIKNPERVLLKIALGTRLVQRQSVKTIRYNG